MPDTFDNAIDAILAEEKHLASINDCIIYFLALAETRSRGFVSDLFGCLRPGLSTDLSEESAVKLRRALEQFVEKCPAHPSVNGAFRILATLFQDSEMKSFLLSKLKSYYQRREAGVVFQLCIVIENLGFKVFYDENGAFIPSRSCDEGDKNLGVARRFLIREKLIPE